MNIEFKAVEISDRNRVLKYFENHKCPSLEYNFTTIFIWQKIFNTEIAEFDGCLLIKSGKHEKKSFLFPVGTGNEKNAIEFLFQYVKSQGYPLRFHSLMSEQKEFLETNFPDKFKFYEDRDSGDYVYSAESLRNLTGKKLASKRNHINRFIENHPEWEYIPMTPENMHEAMDMHVVWCDGLNCEDEPGLKDETCAVKRAFKYFKELELLGAMLKTKDGVCAFTMGDKLNDKTFLVHIEKAFADVQGAYPMINKQFVINAADGFEFINREDDTGDEGLRRAKLSYQPIEIIQKFNAEAI